MHKLRHLRDRFLGRVENSFTEQYLGVLSCHRNRSSYSGIIELIILKIRIINRFSIRYEILPRKKRDSCDELLIGAFLKYCS